MKLETLNLLSKNIKVVWLGENNFWCVEQYYAGKLFNAAAKTFDKKTDALKEGARDCALVVEALSAGNFKIVHNNLKAQYLRGLVAGALKLDEICGNKQNPGERVSQAKAIILRIMAQQRNEEFGINESIAGDKFPPDWKKDYNGLPDKVENTGDTFTLAELDEFTELFGIIPPAQKNTGKVSIHKKHPDGYVIGIIKGDWKDLSVAGCGLIVTPATKDRFSISYCNLNKDYLRGMARVVDWIENVEISIPGDAATQVKKLFKVLEGEINTELKKLGQGAIDIAKFKKSNVELLVPGSANSPDRGDLQGTPSRATGAEI